ncbi:MAG TPA: hypothetical protein VGJ06_03850 [Candidatus Acidoferrum sp.]|jgi:hypothetical protein
MDLFAREKELREQFETNQVQFLLIEVDTGMTFCDVAKTSANPEKVKRNIANARTAYDTLLKFLDRAHFDAASKSAFDQKFARLQSLLRDLGQQI